MNVSPTIRKIANAIATAEGFYVPGSRPQRNNNPGNLTKDLILKNVGWDGPFPIFANETDGWENLYKQVSDMLSGLSSHYNPSMSISEIAQIYSPVGWENWETNVANYLGVSTDTPLSQIT